jgi:FkbM family methyltransferase
MGRWTVNPVQFVRNLRSAGRLGPTVRDRLGYLAWIYNDKALTPRNPSGRRELTFRLPPPIGTVRLSVRDNAGADQLVFGEVLVTRDYAVDVPEPATVLDLGGNIGLATLYFARRWPRARLAVVEPVPANLEVLRRNFELNGVTATVFSAAVGVADGEVTIALGALDCAHRITDQPATNGRGSIRAEALSIPTIMSRLGWDRIGLLKMDIEGYEATLLRSNPEWLKQVDALCLEAFDGTIRHDELNQIAKHYGFRMDLQGSGLLLWTRP